ncbi:hypothetical protein VTK73DRAFT_8576 [Phialemonium thermophilum]|uniref:Major facilitator superfamily (MFS) profile domain-containing protein n=1 Tax=Phialemonium thermophilum TaxID=223376 RepID=A0ABR3W809_9PEZI
MAFDESDSGSDRSEDSPLLSSRPSSVELQDVEESDRLMDADAHDDRGKQSPGGLGLRSAWNQPATPTGVVTLLTFIIFCLVLSGVMALIPMGRLIEDAVCRRYYGSTEPVDESLCKVDEVQTELAWLGGLYALVNALVSLVVSFPWGMMSDRIGRKPIFRLSFASVGLGAVWTGTILYNSHIFPIRLMLLAPLFYVFGGGVSVMVAVIHSIIADVATEKSAGFMWLSIGAVVGGVAGPTISGILMQVWNPWVPLYISGAFLPVIFFSTVFLPETCPGLSRSTQRPTSARHRGNTPFGAAIRAYLRQCRRHLVESLAIVRRPSVLPLLYIFFLDACVQLASGQILAQLVSKRFGWKLAQTGYLFSARGAISVVILAALPFLSKFLSRYYFDQAHGIPDNKPHDTERGSAPLSADPSSSTTTSQPGNFMRDLVLARVSLGFLLAGNILTGIARTPAAVFVGQAVTVLAVGLSSLARGLLVTTSEASPSSSSPLPSDGGGGDDGMGNMPSKQERTESARLFALTGMVETLGSIVAGPSLAWAFDRGMRLGRGGLWMGLPFFYVAALCGFGLVALAFVRLPGGRTRVDEDVSA